ncbi:hypothetical protein HN388_00545 [bacterium]|nr:hypothetical protein [bacterium]MBT7310793.1 hypothetical protein [bacterium]
MADSCSILEEKMMRAVGAIRELKVNNSRLIQQRDELEAHVEALQIEIGRLKNNIDEARPDNLFVDNFEKKRRLIEEKVGDLLAELDS